MLARESTSCSNVTKMCWRGFLPGDVGAAQDNHQQNTRDTMWSASDNHLATALSLGHQICTSTAPFLPPSLSTPDIFPAMLPTQGRKYQGRTGVARALGLSIPRDCRMMPMRRKPLKHLQSSAVPSRGRHVDPVGLPEASAWRGSHKPRAAVLKKRQGAACESSHTHCLQH
jgi:hypothetical protein